MPSALLFPGQGSQTAEMRELVERHEPRLAEVVLSEVGADPERVTAEVLRIQRELGVQRDEA